MMSTLVTRRPGEIGCTHAIVLEYTHGAGLASPSYSEPVQR